MNPWIFKLISFAALAATIFPCLLYFADLIDPNVVNQLALAGTIVWFIATPFWMGRKSSPDSVQVE